MFSAPQTIMRRSAWRHIMQALIAVGALLCLLPAFADAATIRVPGDANTIALAMEAATSLDTVLVLRGTRNEHGITVKPGVKLFGETGDPADVIIDGNDLGGILILENAGDSTEIRGLSFRQGATGIGGAIYCTASSPVIADCSFTDCDATYGGAVSCWASSSPAVSNCVFFDCQATNSGGAIYIKASSSPTITNCTIRECGAYYGGGIRVDISSHPLIGNCIIAFGNLGSGVSVAAGSSATLSCTDIHDNFGGDWEGAIADQLGVGGNMALDPEFCGIPGSGNCYLQSDSPCAPANNDCGMLIGALPVLCSETATESRSWGALKALY